MVQVYSEMQEQIGEKPMLSPGLWQTITWGLATISMSLKNYDVLYQELLLAKEGKSLEEASDLDEQYKFYYYPFLSYLTNYMPIALECIRTQDSAQSEIGKQQQAETCFSFERDLLIIISKCSLKVSNDDIERVLFTPINESLILEHLKKHDVRSFKYC